MKGTFYTPREFLIPKGAIKASDKKSDAVAYLFNNRNGQPAAMIFLGKQAKPVANYRFKDTAKREQFVTVAFQNRRDALARKAAFKKERDDWTPTYKVGDVFRCSWGYDQTNIDYFELIEIKGKKLGVFRELAQERVTDGFMQGKCVPLPGTYCGEPIIRKLQKSGIKFSDVQRGSLVEGQNVGGVKVYAPSSWSAYA